MAEEIKYTHTELVRAVNRIQELAGYSKEVDASKKAGEILNDAIDEMEKTVYKEVNKLNSEEVEVKSGFDEGAEFKL
jgi:hypothetical protein